MKTNSKQCPARLGFQNNPALGAAVLAPPPTFQWLDYPKGDPRCIVTVKDGYGRDVNQIRNPCGVFVPDRRGRVSVKPESGNRQVPFPVDDRYFSWIRVCRRNPEFQTAGTSNYGEPDIPGTCLRNELVRDIISGGYKNQTRNSTCPFQTFPQYDKNGYVRFDPSDANNFLTRQWRANGYLEPNLVICERIRICLINRSGGGQPVGKPFRGRTQ